MGDADASMIPDKYRVKNMEWKISTKEVAAAAARLVELHNNFSPPDLQAIMENYRGRIY